MAAYENFSRVYDVFMDNVPYREWADFLIGRLREEGIEDGLLLDLGCGTGSLTRLLSRAGYDMIGVDASSDMLQIAQEKEAGRAVSPAEDGHSAPGSGRDNPVLYLLQDMRDFELYGTVRAIISSCDSLNYITEEEDLLEVFRLVNNYLDPGGLFLFDMNTVYTYENLLADNTFAESRPDCSFIWENSYDPESGINEYDLTLFLRQGQDGREVRNTDEEGAEDIPDGSLYARYMETHLERAWPLEKIKETLAKAGMEFVCVYDGYSLRPLAEDSERMLIIAREHGKKL